jgi:hypothetical protein
VAQATECLPSKIKALSLNSNTDFTKKKKEKKKRREKKFRTECDFMKAR